MLILKPQLADGLNTQSNAHLLTLTKDTVEDSATVRAITLVTLIYLPASFISVSDYHYHISNFFYEMYRFAQHLLTIAWNRVFSEWIFSGSTTTLQHLWYRTSSGSISPLQSLSLYSLLGTGDIKRRNNESRSSSEKLLERQALFKLTVETMCSILSSSRVCHQRAI